MIQLFNRGVHCYSLANLRMLPGRRHDWGVATGIRVECRHGLDVGLDQVDQRLRPDADPQAQYADRRQRERFAEVHVADVTSAMMFTVMRFHERTEQQRLQHREEIPSSQDQARRAEDGVQRVTCEHPGQREDLADENKDLNLRSAPTKKKQRIATVWI